MNKSIEIITNQYLLDGNYFAYEEGSINIPNERLLQLAHELPSTSTVLDIGAGFGRSSMPFALKGMPITAIDEVGTYEELLTSLSEQDIHFDIVREASPSPFDIGQFDVVLLNDVLFHAPSSDDAIAMLEWAYAQVRPGGYMWANYIVSESVGLAKNERDASGYNPYLTQIGPVHFIGHCACSGVPRDESIIFAPPLQYPLWAAEKGAILVDSKLAPASFEEYWDSRLDDKEFLDTKDKCYLLLQKPI